MKPIKIMIFFFILLNIGCDTTWIINKNIENYEHIDIKCLIQAIDKIKGVTEVTELDPLNSKSYFGNPIIAFEIDNCSGWIRIKKTPEGKNLIEIYQTKISAIKPLSVHSKPVEQKFELIAKNIVASCGGNVQLKYRE